MSGRIPIDEAKGLKLVVWTGSGLRLHVFPSFAAGAQSCGHNADEVVAHDLLGTEFMEASLFKLVLKHVGHVQGLRY
eukprot:2477405-Amphidinium_carterae.1